MYSTPVCVPLLPLLPLLLSRFGRVRLCATPQMAAHQAPPSLGFSRQEHWSGLLFPSPVRETEKWKGSRSGSSFQVAVVGSGHRAAAFLRSQLWLPAKADGAWERSFFGSAVTVQCARSSTRQFVFHLFLFWIVIFYWVILKYMLCVL